MILSVVYLYQQLPSDTMFFFKHYSLLSDSGTCARSAHLERMRCENFSFLPRVKDSE
jgi:hypothetical protein